MRPGTSPVGRRHPGRHRRRRERHPGYRRHDPRDQRHHGGHAAAVEEQGAATLEIARNVQQTASGAQEISSNIAAVTQAANGTGDAADAVFGAPAKLTEQADRLKQEVGAFMAEARAA
jgi:hypothetical protein